MLSEIQEQMQKYYTLSGTLKKWLDNFRESVGLGVDAIAMMGHPGDEALMPLAKQAAENGIIMTYQNVDPSGGASKIWRRICWS